VSETKLLIVINVPTGAVTCEGHDYRCRRLGDNGCCALFGPLEEYTGGDEPEHYRAHACNNGESALCALAGGYR
jgi:hypothetical protein